MNNYKKCISKNISSILTCSVYILMNSQNNI